MVWRNLTNFWRCRSIPSLLCFTTNQPVAARHVGLFRALSSLRDSSQNGRKTSQVSHSTIIQPDATGHFGPFRALLTGRTSPFARQFAPSSCSLQIRNYASKNTKKDKKGPKVIEFSSDEIGDVVDMKEYESALKNLVEEFREQLAKQFVLRTSSASFDAVLVEVNGQKTHLNEIAQITFKTPQLIMINLSATPNDVQPVVTALNQSGLNLNPQVEGHIVYIPVPKVSRDHREAISKGAKAACNKFKERMRHIQNTYVKLAKAKEDASADVVHNAVKGIMQLAEQHGKELDSSLAAKQKDLLGTEER
ncbi:putative Ribosome-recycling factor, mitochondrial [Hypsibius exemplaris]|uniref:Ribosome-recycling factor, mitochondrial n=1 Tax=Hypsibius exemplaris TaxID=2072580 RepID=A0A1W0XDG0_HYPEX|nr:putative Ribosome-recycling factor, mitochondrial [Hypsibius exemplaris]